MVNVRTELIQRVLNSSAFGQLLETYNVAITAVLALVTVALIALFFINVTKLSTAGDNEMKRREAINGIFVCLICIAIIGSIDAIYAILIAMIFSAGP